MFIKELRIKNFKCFNNEFKPLIFNIPDGKNPGSGLNIFAGENNSGKSTIFEAINFLRNNTKKNIEDIKNKNASDDSEISVDIVFSGSRDSIKKVIENFSQENKKAVFNKYVYSPNGKDEYFRAIRSSKEDLKVVQLWDNEKATFKNETGIDAPLKKLFELNFVWADTNPNDEVSFGSTTICGSLLGKIAESFENTDEYTEFSKQFQRAFNDEGSWLRKELKRIEKRTQKIFSEQFGNASIEFYFKEPGINSFLKNETIKIDDGILTDMKEKGSGMQRSIALSLLQVYAEEIRRHPENPNISKPSFLFIDEPETCLHPRAQSKLLDAILKLSKTKQIFLATHSPYFLDNSKLIKNTGLFVLKRNVNKIRITNISKGRGLFPWSPSLGEITYFAYNVPTIEFHNELYGYIKEKNEKYNEKEIEAYFSEHGLQKNKQWIKEYNGISKTPNDVSLQTFIRNKAHHPENRTMQNKKYSLEELRQSIDKMIELIWNE